MGRGSGSVAGSVRSKGTAGSAGAKGTKKLDTAKAKSAAKKVQKEAEKRMKEFMNKARQIHLRNVAMRGRSQCSCSLCLESAAKATPQFT